MEVMMLREKVLVISNWNGKRKRWEGIGIKRGEIGVGGGVERKDFVEKLSLIWEINWKEEVWKDKDSSKVLLFVGVLSFMWFSG